MYTNIVEIHKKMIMYLNESRWKIARHATGDLYNFTNIYYTNYVVTTIIYVTDHSKSYGWFSSGIICIIIIKKRIFFSIYILNVRPNAPQYFSCCVKHCNKKSVTKNSENIAARYEYVHQLIYWFLSQSKNQYTMSRFLPSHIMQTGKRRFYMAISACISRYPNPSIYPKTVSQ